MLGNLLKGVAWCSTIALSTVGALTFVSDEAWERFPAALAPTRAQLAQFGIAPIKYRPDFCGEHATVGPVPRESLESDDLRDSFAMQDSDEPEREVEMESTPKAKSRVKGRFGLRNRIRDRFEAREPEVVQNDSARDQGFAQQDVNRRQEETASVPSKSQAFAPIAAPNPSENTREGYLQSEKLGPLAEKDPIVSDLDDTFRDFTGDLFNENFAAVPRQDSIISSPESSWAQNESPAPQSDVVTAPLPPEIPKGSFGQTTRGQAPDFPSSFEDSATYESIPNPPAQLGRPQTFAQNPPLEFHTQITPETSAKSVIEEIPAAPYLSLDEAIAAATNPGTDDQTRSVFTNLNAIRCERGANLSQDETQKLNKALDKLAYEVFYNPSRSIVESPRQTLQGESLASIAKEYNVTPEYLAAINGVNTPIEEPLQSGTMLKVARGPVAAKVSLSKKELLLTFNGLYAGRFMLGTPKQATTLRGQYIIENKLENPSCDAVDVNGVKTTIPGGAPNNPLGSRWISLSGGYGLQGTNRPELIGTVVPENGGFVFSNKEISQLAILLPVGATVEFVE